MLTISPITGFSVARYRQIIMPWYPSPPGLALWVMLCPRGHALPISNMGRCNGMVCGAQVRRISDAALLALWRLAGDDALLNEVYIQLGREW